MTTSPALARAFRELRKRGITAIRSKRCCPGCGSETEDAKLRGPHALVLERRLREAERLGRPYSVYFGVAENYDYPTDPGWTEATRVGGVVVEALRRSGLSVEWTGTAADAIRVSTR